MAAQSARSNPAVSPNQLGKYRLVATLGQGGMGTVHLACATGLGEFRKLIVVKELRQDLPWKDSSLSMFMDEARLAARLDHPNVVQTFEADQDAGRYFLAMEYLDGQPLSALVERMRQHGGVPLPVHIQILSDALAGLQYAHELTDYDGSPLHVVHRDVSPQNVFVTYHGQVKVVDFGVAKAGNASTFTSPGMFKGKFAYAAPEQALGRPVDARSDVFAIGVMLWEAIAGRRFSPQNPTPTAFRARAAGQEPRTLQAVSDVDPLLAEICDRALEVDAEVRFPSAEAMRSELQEYLLVKYGRVDNAQIGELMRGLFERERRAMHRTIEQAMGHDGHLEASSISVVPEVGDFERTAVADLSSLVLVSHEADEDKIRLSYQHSKITPLRPIPNEAPPERKRNLKPALIGGAAVVAGTLLLTTLLSTSSHSTVTAVPLPSGPSAPLAAPRSAQTAPNQAPQRAAANSPSAPQEKPAPSAALDASEPAAAPGQAAPGRPLAKAAAAISPRRHERAAAPVRLAAVSGASPAPTAAPAAEPREDSAMGSDLRGARHAPKPRIDMEDPYQ
jgi:eukaryotic-like serine/threonine-protein kinase